MRYAKEKLLRFQNSLDANLENIKAAMLNVVIEILNTKDYVENINRKKVQRHMPKMGILAVYLGPNLVSGILTQGYPHLLRV